MYIATFQHADDFLARAEDRLLEHEVANSLILGIAKNISRRPDAYAHQPYMATVEEGDTLILAAVMTPPFHLILSSTNADYTTALEILTLDLLNHQWSVTGVGAPTQLAADFARVWQEQTGASAQIETHERIFALHTVNPPATTPGALRLATVTDLPTVSAWVAAFFKEALPEQRQQIEDIQTYTRQRIDLGNFYVWALPDGQIVSLAGKTRPVVSVISVGPVYTPPDFRGKGYASNLVAVLSQHLLDEGWKSCSLFTDLANPISNHIYLRIGYDPVIDFDQYAFA
jgi:Predicted acetyltransferase